MNINAVATLRYVTLRYVTLTYSFKLSRLSYCKNQSFIAFIKLLYILSVLCGYFKFDSLSGKIKNLRLVINKLSRSYL